jgi:hypothetical protein
VAQRLRDAYSMVNLTLAGLLHDAAEAYLGDLVRPLKQGPMGVNYLAVEEYVEEVINERFSVDVRDEKVKDADHWVLTQQELNGARLRYTYDGSWEQDEQDFVDLFVELWAEREVNKPRPCIIGLAGYAQSGKDTMGRILVEEHGFTRIAFADTLRDMLYAMNPLVEWENKNGEYGVWFVQDIVDTFGWEFAKKSVAERSTSGVRHLLQRLGTEAGRDILGQNIWVDTAMKKAAEVKNGRVVFTDVRFPNEADAITEAGGTLWRMQRAGQSAVNTHVSERALDDYEWPMKTWSFSSPETPDHAELVRFLGSLAKDAL